MSNAACMLAEAWEGEICARSSAAAFGSLAEYGRLMAPNFQTPPHIESLVAKLEAVERGEIKRLAVFMPPRHGKSMTSSELFPAWFLGRNPGRSIIAASYNNDLAGDYVKLTLYVDAEQTH